MTVALISDIHSNLEALEAVLADIRGEGVTEIACLGDLVGYGPDPADVMDRAFDWTFCLLGNHDEAVLREAFGFNPVARRAVEWTREQLKPSVFSFPRRRRRWEFLEKLPLTVREDGVLYVHGSPRDPTMEYVMRSDCSDFEGGIPEKIRDIFSRFDRLCFCGHTHDPGVIVEESKFLTPGMVGGEFLFEEGRKYFVNVGSVGQPRDGNPRACYVLFDPPDRIRWRRVEYDIERTRAKILANPRLDPRAGDRLSQGK